MLPYLAIFAHVARVWRRDDHPPSQGKLEMVYLANVERQGILVFYQCKI
jgi:hypothetical protein